LGDGFRVEAEFRTWHGDDVLSVPVAALFRDGDAWATYVVEGGHARLRHVGIGRMSESAAEVTAGLGQGAIVVLYPDDKLRDGMRVRSPRP
jgi:HlyD family secretion protein